MNKNDRFLIVGLGLLGGSYARGLARAGFAQVYAIDTNPEAIRFAKEKGYIADGASENFEELVRMADRVIFALYPTALEGWVARYGGLLRPGCICTDVSGVKAGLVETVQTALAEGVEFIASHPMAGKEVSGVENSHLVDFSPANFLITPTDRNTPEGVEFARWLGRTLGFAHIRVLSCAEHDRMIGYVSQLTHAIAVSLMCAPGAEQFADYTGDSFRDLTRIARINETMWAELFLWNRENLIDEIDGFTARLQALKGYLQQGDRAALEEMFRQSTRARAAFDKKEKEE
ncbi:prephenate dehydrogenase [Allofournierella massiliensis]|uniref:prephenate dehydrogenase n=1 Tax=Allofournierella massiliensis TaxID=1650663 RepID=UPI0024B25308|nr:prephenate dehydrogenase [Fournierella massiliensis]